VREAIEQRQWREAEAQIGHTAQAIVAYAEWIEAAVSKAAPCARAGGLGGGGVDSALNCQLPRYGTDTAP
jgi:hypothetical protein